jgi:hypothetical protein
MSRAAAIVLPALSCGIIFAAATAMNDPILSPAAMAGISLLPLGLAFVAVCMRAPFTLCLLFVVFSFFRIHEAIPVLMPFRIPNMLAILTFASLAINVLVLKTMKPNWHPILSIYSYFFFHVTMGILFAGSKEEALAYWMGTYWKIYVIAIAISWLARTPEHFAAALVTVVTAGLLISAVTISNKLSGIGLVEETRVTIGRDIGSVLGDPNDLSLVLLFPMGFACSLLFTRGISKLRKLYGAAAIPIFFTAILYTQSRGGLLGTLAVWGIFGNRLVKNKVLLAVIGGLGAAVLYAVAGISGRKSGGASEEGLDESAMGRVYAWQAARRMALDHPVFGVGVKNFLLNYYYYSDFWDGHPHEVHSTWFGVMGESGIVGFCVFVAMVAVLFRITIAASEKLQRMEAPAPACAMASAIVAGLVGFCVSGTFLTQGFTWPIYIQLAFGTAIVHYANALSATKPAATRQFGKTPAAA